MIWRTGACRYIVCAGDLISLPFAIDILAKKVSYTLEGVSNKFPENKCLEKDPSCNVISV